VKAFARRSYLKRHDSIKAEKKRKRDGRGRDGGREGGREGGRKKWTIELSLGLE
jgi:hypothetical protein